MKRNYQSWRSQLDGISSPSPSSPPRVQPELNLPPAYPPPPSRSSPTLAHNLYYDRGAHIINLIKRSALKIVLLVRQLLTAAACLPARPILPSVPLAVSPLRFPRLYSFPLRIFVASPRSFLFLSLSLRLPFSFFPPKLRNTVCRGKASFRRRITGFVSNGSLTLCCDEYFFLFFLVIVRRKNRFDFYLVKWNLFRSFVSQLSTNLNDIPSPFSITFKYVYVMCIQRNTLSVRNDAVLFLLDSGQSVVIIVAWSHLFPRCEIGYESSKLARKEEGMCIYRNF